MSDLAQAARIPTWTLGWRLRRSLELADISVQEIARALHVSRGTVSRWLHDDGIPSEPVIVLWARACLVDYEWLSGEKPPPKDGLTILDLINRTVDNQDDSTVNYLTHAA